MRMELMRYIVATIMLIALTSPSLAQRVFIIKNAKFQGVIALGPGACVRGPIALISKGKVLYKLAAGESVNCPIEK